MTLTGDGSLILSAGREHPTGPAQARNPALTQPAIAQVGVGAGGKCLEGTKPTPQRESLVAYATLEGRKLALASMLCKPTGKMERARGGAAAVGFALGFF